MPKFVVLGNFTDQGARNAKETTKRAAAFREMAKKEGVSLRDIYWTLGAHDVLILLDAPDDETVTGLLLSLGALGNLRTQTLRAFSAEEMEKIIAKAP